jgi:hypothetical protein
VRSSGVCLGWYHPDAGWRAHRHSPAGGQGSDRRPRRQRPAQPARLDADLVNGLLCLGFDRWTRLGLWRRVGQRLALDWRLALCNVKRGRRPPELRTLLVSKPMVANPEII